VHSRVSGCRDTAADGEDSICWHWVVDAGAGVLGNIRGSRVVGADWRGVCYGLYWADSGGESNGRGDNAGVVSRAVGDCLGALSDGDELGGVDSRGGILGRLGGIGAHWLGGGVGDGRVSWAVGDCWGAGSDSHDLS